MRRRTATKVLEPKVRLVGLWRGTFVREGEVDAWWEQARQGIVPKLEESPAVISS